VYVFHIEKYRPILRATILTAFLGYLLFCLALFYDLGKYYNIWHATIMWNPHSVMFEVAWCVMLYTLVLALEFFPVFFEGIKNRWHDIYRIFRLSFFDRVLHSLVVPIVILGVILSTLHQSSLGSLFLIARGKLHILWYSPMLPFFFFISAISTGIAMINFESFLSSRFFGRGIESNLLQGLARANIVVLGIYLILKIEDLVWKNAVADAFAFDYESILFLLEMFIGVIIPLILYSIPYVRSDRKLLFAVSFMVIVGIILNRLNVAITGIDAYAGGNYFPSFSEIMITGFITSLGFIAFAVIAYYFPVFPEETRDEKTEQSFDEIENQGFMPLKEYENRT
jgi:Ni/Fe-hydrogenase subunit HybB-like protein